MDDAAESKRRLGLINEEIGRRAGAILGSDPIDESRVSRCLTGETATFELVESISQVLAIPVCVIVAESRAEALTLLGARATFAAGHTEPKKDEMATKVTAARERIMSLRRKAASISIANRHGGAVGSTHGHAAGRNGDGPDSRRKGAGRG